MLSAIKEKLTTAGIALSATWETDVQTWGETVALYRDYSEGNHRAKLTTEMRKMLRISDAKTDQFAINYCDLVIAKMGDRLTVSSIDGDNEAGSAWAGDMLEYNRFDALQMDVHDAAIRDGVTYVMVAYDNAAQKPMLAHELAWDGSWGMVTVYDRMGKKIVAAIKIWYETDTARRVNIYYADRVERFREGGLGGGLLAIDEQSIEWMDVSKSGVGVPVVAFINRAKSRMTTGISEIASVIPMQDALNRTLVSMVMTSELSAFQIKVALGFPPPAEVTPGMWVIIGENGIPDGQKVDAFVLEQAQLVPFISQATFLIDQIGTVSQTPLPNQMGGDSSSGEALKQRETGLLGKLKRFQVKGGNSWEDVMALAARVQKAFGTGVSMPKVTRWSCHWQDAEIRNDSETIKNVKEVADLIGDEQALREIAPVFGWDEDKINQIMAAKRSQQADAFAALGSSLPNFDAVNVDVPTGAGDLVAA